MPRFFLSYLSALSVLSALMLVACSSESDRPAKRTSSYYVPPPGRVPPRSARFKSGPCPVTPPSRRVVECGYLTVPENRDDPASRSIELAVAIEYSRDADSDTDPIVYLEGGPGGSGIDFAFADANPFAPLLLKRDVIVFDQRGAGYSKPSLSCPELAPFSSSEPPPTDGTSPYAAAARQCADRLRSQGVDLNAYTTRENAADLEALRVALGYSTWNLYGTSYGTRLGLTEIRDYPSGVRTLSIDGVLPLQEDFFGHTAINAARAFEAIFTSCSADATCAADFPEIGQTFRSTVAALNDVPATLNLKHGRIDLSGDLFVSVLFELLYNAQDIRYVPLIIQKTHAGDYAFVSQPLSTITSSTPFSYGMYLAVMCADEAPFTSPEQFARFDAGLDPVYASQAPTDIFESCRAFGVNASSELENQAVLSNLPALVTSGEFDPITPPAYGEEAASSLSNSHIYTLTGESHGASFSDCGRILLNSFLDAPDSPDSACVDAAGGIVFRPLRRDSGSKFVRSALELPADTLQRIRQNHRYFPRLQR